MMSDEASNALAGPSPNFPEDSIDFLDSHPDVIAPARIDAIEGSFIWRSDRMRRLVTIAESVAATDSTVLLSGESGVGKEVIARFVHRKSDRADKPFLAINCAAIAPGLLESELFGHKKGAFSGAVQDHHGVFERAQGGTLLLDEISEMPLELQAKLLRVIQERQVTPVGGSRARDIDLRLIATTNRDLEKRVQDGDFRQDLFYRLNVFPLQIPPLRARREDIEPLARFFMAKIAKNRGDEPKCVTYRAMDKLERYNFPGNVRELINLVERALIFAAGSRVIDAHHIMLEDTVTFLDDEDVDDFTDLSINGHISDDVVSFKAGEVSLTDVRRVIILETLRKYNGNRTKTAEVLGVSVRTVRNRLKRYRDAGHPIPE